MNAGFKAWTGLLAFLPLTLFLVSLFGPINLYWIATILAVATLVAAIIVFAQLVKKLDLVPPERRRLWIALLIVGNWVLVPFFWYKHIYKATAGPRISRTSG